MTVVKVKFGLTCDKTAIAFETVSCAEMTAEKHLELDKIGERDHPRNQEKTGNAAGKVND